MKFVQHVTFRLCETLRSKFGFWKQLPYAFFGIFGMYQGFALPDCVALGNNIYDMWGAARTRHPCIE